jgi:hypothetical protein
MRSLSFRLRLVAAVAAAFALTMSGAACMGSFALTRGLYHFNETLTGSKAINNVVFWALGILPVYSLALTGDLLIFNTIEFWTGKNLLADAGGDGAGAGGTAVALNDDGSVTMTRGAITLVATPIGANKASVTRDGELLGTLEELDDGSLVVTDARDATVAVLTAAEAHELGPVLEARLSPTVDSVHSK